MKTNLALPFAVLAFSRLLSATPLTETTAVHTQPDAAAPIVSFLKAGSEPLAATSPATNAPGGWMAIDLPGPFEGYVQNKDLTKGLDVLPGASIYLRPKIESGVLAVAEKGDKTTLTGIQGKWTQVSLEKKLTGYILVPIALGGSTATASGPAVAATTAAPMAPAPVPPVAYGSTTAGRAAPVVSLADPTGASLPRQFVGKFVSTRAPLRPRRPYDWALNDDAGQRFAYLDVSKLLLTEQIEKYLDHAVIVYGAAKNTPGSKDIVIEVESLQLP
jgi:hypothetical protein